MRILFLIFFILPFVFASNAKAHPHAWVDVTVRVLFDDMDRVYAIEENWLFDDLYSVFVTSGADADGDGKPDQEALEEVMRVNLKNLQEYDYFTDIRSGESPIKTLSATDMSTRMQDKRLEMTFTLPFIEPVAATDIPMRYSIYDPTYYIEMVHAEVDEPVKLVDAPDTCRATLSQPDPNPEMIMNAASLDKTQKGINGLGQFFAERVSVSCQ